MEFSVLWHCHLEWWLRNSVLLGRHVETSWVNSHEVFVFTHTVVLPWERSCNTAWRQVCPSFVTTANKHDLSILQLLPIFILTALSYELAQVLQTKSLGSILKHCFHPKCLGRWVCQRSPFLAHPLSEYLAYIPAIHPTSSKGRVEFPVGYLDVLFKAEVLNSFSFIMIFVPFWL